MLTRDFSLKPGQQFSIAGAVFTVEGWSRNKVRLRAEIPGCLVLCVEDPPEPAEAACHVGLSEADYEHKRYMAGQDEEVLLRRMEDERDEAFGEGL